MVLTEFGLKVLTLLALVGVVWGLLWIFLGPDDVA